MVCGCNGTQQMQSVETMTTSRFSRYSEALMMRFKWWSVFKDEANQDSDSALLSLFHDTVQRIELSRFFILRHVFGKWGVFLSFEKCDVSQSWFYINCTSSPQDFSFLHVQVHLWLLPSMPSTANPLLPPPPLTASINLRTSPRPPAPHFRSRHPSIP